MTGWSIVPKDVYPTLLGRFHYNPCYAIDMGATSSKLRTMNTARVPA